MRTWGVLFLEDWQPGEIGLVALALLVPLVMAFLFINLRRKDARKEKEIKNC